jgi:ATP synthase mitochondrial F1 complex assembly factor 2
MTMNLRLTSPSFFEDYPPALVELQTRHWSPLLDWAREEFKADIRIFRSLMSNSQPLETKDIFRRVLDAMDAWQLACKSQDNH